MSLGTLFAKHHPQPVAKNEVVPRLVGEDKETRCRKVMLDACINRPLEAYRNYIGTGTDRWLTELNEFQLREVRQLRADLEAELAT
jgi:hypothetical protein